MEEHAGFRTEFDGPGGCLCGRSGLKGVEHVEATLEGERLTFKQMKPDGKVPGPTKALGVYRHDTHTCIYIYILYIYTYYIITKEVYVEDDFGMMCLYIPS